MIFRKYLIFFSLIILLIPAASKNENSLKKTVLIQDARVLLENGRFHAPVDVLFEAGKILAAGKNLEVPPGTEIIPAGNKWLIPGLIDVYIVPAKLPAENPQKSDYITPNVKVLDALDPTKYPLRDYDAYPIFQLHKDKFPQAANNGVTTIFVIPDSTKITAGMAGLFKPRHVLMKNHIVNDTAALKIGFERKRNVAGISSRMGIVWSLREMFYQAQYNAENQNSDSKKCDRLLEKTLSREIPVLFEINDEQDEANAFALTEEFGLKSIFHGRPMSNSSISAAAGKEISYILSVSDVLENERTINTIKIFLKEQVKYGLCSGGRLDLLKFLTALRPWYQEAGLNEAELYAGAMNTADILGLSHRLGSIAPGKDADLVLLDGNPLAPFSKIEKVFIDGVLIFEAGEK